MKIGIDIIEVKRLKKILGGPNEGRFFTERELEYINGKGAGRFESAAGIFAAKEAYFKALGTGIAHGRIQDVEVTHDELGAPKIKGASLSIAHTLTTAVAVCILT